MKFELGAASFRVEAHRSRVYPRSVIVAYKTEKSCATDTCAHAVLDKRNEIHVTKNMRQSYAKARAGDRTGFFVVKERAVFARGNRDAVKAERWAHGSRNHASVRACRAGSERTWRPRRSGPRISCFLSVRLCYFLQNFRFYGSFYRFSNSSAPLYRNLQGGSFGLHPLAETRKL